MPPAGAFLYVPLRAVIIPVDSKPVSSLELEMRRRLLLTIFAVLLSAMPVMAQSDSGDSAFKEKSVAKEWAIGAVFLVGCLLVAFKPAKRANVK